MNYDILMEEEIKKIEKKNPTLLLHACCAPCSSAVLERLGDIFEITIFYYNPNITDQKEYQKRLDEIHMFISKFKTKNKIKILDGRYDPNEYFNMAKGLENEPERGKRCYKCYELRLDETAKVAKELDFDYFTTTLSLSPHKNSNWINEIGENLDKKILSAVFLRAGSSFFSKYSSLRLVQFYVILVPVEIYADYVNLWRDNYEAMEQDTKNHDGWNCRFTIDIDWDIWCAGSKNTGPSNTH